MKTVMKLIVILSLAPAAQIYAGTPDACSAMVGGYKAETNSTYLVEGDAVNGWGMQCNINNGGGPPALVCAGLRDNLYRAKLYGCESDSTPYGGAWVQEGYEYRCEAATGASSAGSSTNTSSHVAAPNTGTACQIQVGSSISTIIDRTFNEGVGFASSLSCEKYENETVAVCILYDSRSQMFIGNFCEDGIWTNTGGDYTCTSQSK